MNEFKDRILPFCKKDGMKTDSGDQRPNILGTPEQRRFAYFYSKLKKSKNI